MEIGQEIAWIPQQDIIMLGYVIIIPISPWQADAGGLVSPGGLSYIGRSKEILGEIPGAVAIKRMDLDEALAREAQR